MRYAAITDRLAHLGSAKWEVHIRARAMTAAGVEVLSLSIGEPDVPPSAELLTRAQEAMQAGRHGYSNGRGEPGLLAALAARYSRRTGRTIGTNQIICLPGTQTCLYAVLTALVGPGDEVLVGDPMYATYEGVVVSTGAAVVPVPLRPEHGFRLQAADLTGAITPRTRAILLNTPHNPTGAVLTRADVRAIGEVAKAHDLWIISDEVYEAFVYETEHVSIASLGGADRILSAFSLSKTYAMTGVRVGYLVTPPGFSATMRTVQEATISCVAAPDQRAAIAAIEGDQTHVHAASRHYRDNFETAAALLEERGIRYHRPQGAFYLWVDVSYASNGDVAGWARDFVLEQRVAVAPGSAFGRSGEGWIRVCLAASEAAIVDGLGRLPAFGG